MKYLTRISLLFIGLLLFFLPLQSARASTPKTALGSIEMTEDTFDYTGEEIHPEFTVYDINGNIVSPESYNCEYIGAVNSSNENTKIYVTAKEDSAYKGGLRKQFFIKPVSIKKATVSEIPDSPYTGAYQKPLPVLTYNGKALTKGTDYTVSYTDNLNAGTATVTITGSATASETKTNKNFTDEISLSFTITPISIENYTITPIADKTYTGSAVTPGVSLMLGDKKLGSSNYKLTYKNNVNAGTATVTATGTGNYCSSISTDFRILPKVYTPKIHLSSTKYVYDTKVKTPTVKKVTVGTAGTVLKASDYTVKYSAGRKAAGTYDVTVTLKGNYTGQNTAKFIIEPQSISKAKIVLEKRTYTYSGKAFKPKLTVTLDGAILKNGTDYKVTYSSNKNPGNGKVQIEGTGNYKGKPATQSFLIRKDIQKFTVTPKAKSFKISYSKLKKADQKLPVTKTLKISKPVGEVIYEIGHASAEGFSIDNSTGTIFIAKGTPKGTYELTLRLCAKGDGEHVICYRLTDIRITVK